MAERRPDLVGELHPTRNGELDPGTLGVWSAEKVWWQCGRCRHDWQATVKARAAQGAGCPACGPRATASVRRRGPRAPIEQRSLAVVRPDLVDQLLPARNPELDPHQVSVWSRRRVWWRCPCCAHEWEAMIMNRHQGSACPVCATSRRVATYQHDRPPVRECDAVDSAGIRPGARLCLGRGR